MIAIAFNFAPALAYATCQSTGHISRVVAVASPAVSSFYVIAATHGLPPTTYKTTDASLVGAALAAQKKNMIVEVTGLAPSCPAAAVGVVNGGAAQMIVKKSQPSP
jgi:hypothetical protein